MKTITTVMPPDDLIRSGWINLATGETYNCTPDQRQIPNTRWHRLTHWPQRCLHRWKLRREKAAAEAEAARKQRAAEEAAWRYYGTARIIRRYAYSNGVCHTVPSEVSIYVNDLLKRARDSEGDPIDYNAVINGGHYIPL